MMTTTTKSTETSSSASSSSSTSFWWNNSSTEADNSVTDASMDRNLGTTEDYDQMVWTYVEPNWLEYGSLAVFAILLITGLVGNFLVIFVVIRNESMRTMTNLFLVNLAFSDFMVLLFCLPFTVLWEITKTWWFGTALCKIIVYWQTLSVSVSILTLTCISVERWHAICHPLSFRNTFKRTRISLLIIWLSAALLSLPEMIVLRARPFNFNSTNYTSTYLTQCTHTWNESWQQAYQLAQTSVLYVLPLSCMGVLYGHIAYVLWLKSIPPSDCSSSTTPRVSASSNNIAAAQSATITTAPPVPRKTSSRVMFTSTTDYLPVSVETAAAVANERKTTPDRLKPPSMNMPTSRTSNAGLVVAKSANLTPDQWKEREILNRRKAAKMLIAIVVLFAICYLPTHVLNILTYFGAALDFGGGFKRSAVFLCIRFMCYFNSCVNPLIYNFMSEKFQKEFRRACSFLPAKYRRTNGLVAAGYPTTYESSALLAHGGRPGGGLIVSGKPVDHQV